MNTPFKVTKEISGRTLTLESGKLAKQADGAVTVRYGDTVVFVAAVSSPADDDKDFFPLTVDYREMKYAAGKIPGGFFKREGRPTHKETITARSIDRPIRPMFPESYRDNVSISALALSADEHNDPDVLSMIGASAALRISSIPFQAAIGSVRMGRVDGKWIVNPTYSEVREGTMDMILSGTKDKIVMIEVEAKEIPEAEILEAIQTGHKAIQQIIELQEELVKLCGKPKKEMPAEPDASPFMGPVEKTLGADLKKAVRTRMKLERKEALSSLKKKAQELAFSKANEEQLPMVKRKFGDWFDALVSRHIRQMTLEENLRVDGRKTNELRQLSCELSVLPRTHGSAIFARGETQALVALTLGTKSDEQKIDGLGPDYYKSFLLAYNFPAFSVGETWANRGPKRREIGHGDLAERSLQAIIPSHDDFPYTIRLVSDIMESNGSTSMASVCGGTLALMDAGVPITSPVAGISIGLVLDGNKHVLLTDINGDEDHYGDMDFKVAGTAKGVTGVQVDLKIQGLPFEIVQKAFMQARETRMQILEKIKAAIPAPRAALAAHAPKLTRIRIRAEKIGLIIGPGGRTIREMQAQSGATIEVDDEGSEGVVTIYATSAAAVDAAKGLIEAMAVGPTPGKVYTGKVTGIKDFGVFVEIIPGVEGLVHVSELSDKFVKDVKEHVKVGDTLEVKVLSVDEQGRIKLSRKALLSAAAQQ